MPVDENAISSLLSSPEGVNKIMSVIRMLSGSDKEPDAPAPAEHEASPPPSPSGLSSLLSGEGGMDPRMMSVLTSLMSGFGDQSNNDRIRLLTALKPFLNGKRKLQVDNAIQAVRIARAAVAALNGWSAPSGGDNHV